MKKIILTAFFALFTYMGLLSVCAFGESAPIEPVVTYGNCGWNDGDNLTWHFESGTLTISGEGEMGLYFTERDNSGNNVVAGPWYHLRDSIHTVVIEEGVQNIQDYAFAEAYNLKAVQMASSVKLIGVCSFENCLSLKKIDLPGVEYIDAHAFTGCNELETVILGESLINMGLRAFSRCPALKEISAPAHVIERDEFSYCNRLKSIYIGNQFELEYWDSDGVAALFGDDFNAIKLLEELDGINLSEIRVGAKNRYLKDEEGVLFDKSGEVLIRYPKMKSDKSYTVPNGVKIIWEEAFKGCANLEQVDFPNTLEHIGQGAFYGRSSLKSIFVPDEVAIGRNANWCQGNTFRDCISLKSASVPELVEYMFSGCKSLKNITIRTTEGPREYVWPEGAFLNCFNLERIEFSGKSNRTILLPTGLEEIGERIVYGYDFPDNTATLADHVVIDEVNGFAETESLPEAGHFEYADEENPYTNICFGNPGEVFLIHKDGTVTVMFTDKETLISKHLLKNEIESWTDVKQIVRAMGWSYIALKNDGTLVYTVDEFDGMYGEFQTLAPTTYWKDIESIRTDYYILVGLCTDGSVFVLGGYGLNDLRDWNDIDDIAVHECISEYSDRLVGVTRDGRLKEDNTPRGGSVSIGGYDSWLGSIDHAISVQSVAEPYGGFIILKEGGTVAVSDHLAELAYELSQWKDIVQIESVTSEASYAAIGLREDGTVVTTGELFPESRAWTNVKQIVTWPYNHSLYAVDETGNVLECGNIISHKTWKKIDKLYYAEYGIIGITNDGRVLSDIELF